VNIKLKKMKTTINFLQIAVITLIIMVSAANAQTYERIAVLNIDTKGLTLDPAAMGDLIRLELDKTKTYNVMDKYDMADIVAQNELDITNCYGKSCLVETAKVLNVEKVLTGSAERFGEKIVITLRLIDVKTSMIEKSDVTEYMNMQPHIQHMAEISVRKLLRLENDPALVGVLVNFKEPITSVMTKVKLNGPRMGVAYIEGDLADVLTAPRSQGGYDCYPVLSQFGYQWEIQYLSAGEFQALVEFLGVVSGLEQQLFIPTMAFMNGFRISKKGWEVAFGPTVSFNKTRNGFFDTDGLLDGDKDQWYLSNEWDKDIYGDNPYEIVKRADSRGIVGLSPGWIWSAGRTFKSGYLNIPVNLYVSPKKSGWFLGASVGFNVIRSQKVK